MNKYHQVILAIALTDLTTSVIAAPLSYTFISASSDTFSFRNDGVPEDFEGNQISFTGSVSVAGNFAALAGYATGNTYVTSSGITSKVNRDTVALGALFHAPVDTSMDFVVGAWLLRDDVDASGTPTDSETSNGNDLFLGIRAMSEKFEVDVFVHRVEYEDTYIDTSINFGLGYYIVKDVSLDAGYSFGGDISAWSFGVTKYF